MTDLTLQPVDLATFFRFEIGDETHHPKTGGRVVVVDKGTCEMDEAGVRFSAFFLKLGDLPAHD